MAAEWPRCRSKTMSKDALKDSVLSHLKYTLGKDADHATIYDWRVALSQAVRDRIVDPWFETTRATYRNDAKRVTRWGVNKNNSA